MADKKKKGRTFLSSESIVEWLRKKITPKSIERIFQVLEQSKHRVEDKPVEKELQADIDYFQDKVRK